MLRFIGAITFAFVFSSCSNKSDSILAVFKAAEEGLIQSNSAISNSSTVVYHALNKKLSEPESARQASVWQPKALLIKEKTAEIINYLDFLIIELKKEAGLRLENMREVYNEDDLDAVSRLFIKKNAGEELYEKLQNYRTYILSVDQELYDQFLKTSIIITREFEQAGSKQNDFTKFFFNNVPVITALTMLRKFENNVRVLENMFITYCNNKVPSNGWNLIITAPLISQSFNHIKGGGEMEIIAGVGAYYTQAQPQITINGIAIPFDNSQGFGKYKFKTPLKAGKYSVPVKIEYIDYDGTKKMIIKKVDYTVAE